jgi:hypothetical protein
MCRSAHPMPKWYRSGSYLRDTTGRRVGLFRGEHPPQSWYPTAQSAALAVEARALRVAAPLRIDLARDALPLELSAPVPRQPTRCRLTEA